MQKKLGELGGFLIIIALLLFLFPTSSSAEKLLVIDPGHGGKYSGTCGYSGNQTGICEKNVNLSVALKLRDLLKGSDIKVQLTRSNDTAFSSFLNGSGGDMEKRMQVANGYAKGNNDNSVFISIHHNASPTSPYVKGTETYWYDGIGHYQPDWPHDPLQIVYNKDNKRLAELVHPRLYTSLSTINRGIGNNQSFYVIRNAQMPAILVELGYMTNRDEESRIKTATFQQNAAKALAEGVKEYFRVFDVYDKSNKMLATFKTQNEAVSYLNKTANAYRVFDKDKQKDILFKTMDYQVINQSTGVLDEFPTLNDAINYATNKANTRIITKSNGWTVWSNYLSKKYDVYVGGTLNSNYYDYENAYSVASKNTNAKIVRKSTGDILWTNQSGVVVTRDIKSTKVSGIDRYATAVEISKSLYPQGFATEKEQKVVILATGENPADALSAGPLTKQFEGAPILLTTSKAFDPSAKAEITRLAPDKVIIIGGLSAVSVSIEKEIRDVMGIEVERIQGIDRYETNQQILSRLTNVNGIFVASGYSYADALSVAPIAAANDWGIVLTEKFKIASTSLNYMTNKPVVIVGGTAVVSDMVKSTIQTSQASSIKRLSGATRYETITEVLRAFKNEVASEQVLVSTGTNFPDALVSASLAIQSNSPLILVDKYIPVSIDSFLQEYAETNYVKQVTVIGGVQAVSDLTTSKIVNKLK